jgi:hypothetical protein
MNGKRYAAVTVHQYVIIVSTLVQLQVSFKLQ